jgi:hypothetical protein
MNACSAGDLADAHAAEAVLGHRLQGCLQHGVADAGGSPAGAATHLAGDLVRAHTTNLNA